MLEPQATETTPTDGDRPVEGGRSWSCDGQQGGGQLTLSIWRSAAALGQEESFLTGGFIAGQSHRRHSGAAVQQEDPPTLGGPRAMAPH